MTFGHKRSDFPLCLWRAKRTRVNINRNNSLSLPHAVIYPPLTPTPFTNPPTFIYPHTHTLRYVQLYAYFDERLSLTQSEVFALMFFLFRICICDCICTFMWFLQVEIPVAPWLSALATNFCVIKTGSREDETFNKIKVGKPSNKFTILQNIFLSRSSSKKTNG